MIIALGSGIATGTTALISNAIGEGDRKKASEYIGQAISFTMLIGIAMTVVGLLISPFLFKILGAGGQYLSLGLSYMNVILLGTVFFLLIYTFNAILNAQGDARTFRNYLIGGFFLNIILDPWFMYGGFGIPAMGLAGVAWATVLIQFLGTLYVGLSGSCFGDFLRGLPQRACPPEIGLYRTCRTEHSGIAEHDDHRRRRLCHHLFHQHIRQRRRGCIRHRDTDRADCPAAFLWPEHGRADNCRTE